MAKKTKLTTANIIKAMGLADEKKIVLACGTGENAIEIAIKNRLTLPERANMIRDILDMIFIEDVEGNIGYHAAFKKFAFEYEIVNYFTDISLPVESNKAWDFLERTNIVPRIVGAVEEGYIAEIISEANEMIEYRKTELLKRSKLDSIFDAIVDVVGTIRDVSEGVDLGQILAYAQENTPEFKDKLDALLKSEVAEASAD